MQRGIGVFAGPDVEGGWLDRPDLRLRAPEHEFILSEREFKGLGFAGLQRHAPESLKLLYWSGCRAIALVDINLCHRVAGDRSRIGHVDRDLGGVIAVDTGLAQAEVGKLESRIAEPIPERVQRLVRDVPVARSKIRLILGLMGEVV